jgi:uncharacterized protein DUF4177
MPQWEYKQVRGVNIEQALNALGKEGWELVSVMAEPAEERFGHVTQLATLKREIKAAEPPGAA